jgi:hypothetical protein
MKPIFQCHESFLAYPFSLRRFWAWLSLIAWIVLLFLAPRLLVAQPSAQQSAEAGKWIPLPYYLSGSWWLPVNPDDPIKIKAGHVALAGRDCYLVSDEQSDLSLFHESGREIVRARQVISLDADHFGFLQDGAQQFGIVRIDGKVTERPTMSVKTIWNRKTEFKHQAVAAPPAMPQSNSLSESGWAITSNSQSRATVYALDYSAALGLLCAVQRVGEFLSGSGLRVWDVRSRSCLWTQRLPGPPNAPVSVCILDNGLVFVNGGYGKMNMCYLRVYDINKRQLVFERDVTFPGLTQLGRLRMSPLPLGHNLLTIPSLCKENGPNWTDVKGVRLFELATNTEQILAADHEVSAVMALKDGKSALLGTLKGEVFRLSLADGRTEALGSSGGKMITALTVANNESMWAAGTEDGRLLCGSLHNDRSGVAALANLDGEITSLAFLRGSSSSLAIRVAGSGKSGFYGGYSVDISKEAKGMFWNTQTNARQPLPAGAGISSINDSVLMLGLSDDTGIVFYDSRTGQQSEALGIPAAAAALKREAVSGVGIDKPSSLRTNLDGSQLLINGLLFDFRNMRFEPVNAARDMPPPILQAACIRMRKPVPVDGDSERIVLDLAEHQGGPTVDPQKYLDLLLLGSKKRPSQVLLSHDPGTRSAFSGVSPSGKVAAIYSQWKGSGDLRLVDLERERVMSQPNQGNLSENLQSMSDLGWMKPLDDSGSRVLVIHANAGMADMLDYASGRTLSRLEFGGVAAAACCAVGARRLFIATDDSTIHCLTWDDQGILKPMGRLNLGVNESWTLTLPNGLFMASGAERMMALAGKGRSLPLDTGAAAFHRPHEVARAFDAAPDQIRNLERAYLRRCQRDHLSVVEGSEVKLDTLPQVTIRDRLTLPPVLRQSQLNLAVEAKSPGAALRKLRVEVNGAPLYPWHGDLTPETKQWAGEIPIHLSRGTNKIQISAIDTQGRESLRETLVVWLIAEPVRPDVYVLAIGVSDYRDHDLTLGAAAKDARDLARVFSERQGRDCREVKTLVITDQQAVRENILQAREFLRSSKEEDQVIIFVAGHGFVDQDGLRYWFGTHDIDIEAVEKRGVSYEELEGLFEGVPARQRLLLMDTCFAGEVDVEAPAMLALASGVKSRAPAVSTILRKPPDGSYDLMKEMFSDLRKNTGATVITASSGMEYVFAEERAEGDNGVFTYCLLNGLRSGKADADGDGLIRVSEMQQYLLAKVPAMTGGRQRPTGRHLNQDADFVIGTAVKRPKFDARTFVNGYLELTTSNNKRAETLMLFAPAVDYFGKSQTPDQIMTEEDAYHQKYPQRNFNLNQTPPAVEITGDDSRRVNYTMTYHITSQTGEIKSGSQDIAMDVALHDSTWKVCGLRVVNAQPNPSTPPPVVTRGPVTAPPAQNNTMQGVIIQFLSLSSANGQENQFVGMFADTVDYFGKRFTRAQIYADEIATHRNWSYRRLDLTAPLEQINVSPDEVMLRYTMSTWQSKTPNGGKTSIHRIEMRLRSINGRWFISSMKIRK